MNKEIISGGMVTTGLLLTTIGVISTLYSPLLSKYIIILGVFLSIPIPFIYLGIKIEMEK